MVQAAIAPFVVSLGDPAGIGPEIIGKAWEARTAAGLSPFFAVGSARALAAGWNGPVIRIEEPDAATACFADALPLLALNDPGDVVPGRPTIEGAQSAFHALEIATGFARTGSVAGVVTGPVSKAQLYKVGFTHPGQTEFIAERCGIAAANAVMMLAGPSLRVVPMTTHIPLVDVPAHITADLIRQRAIASARGLERDFGITRPRLAVAGLNPHAGEGGAMGDEEQRVIAPAIAMLRDEGLDIVGPLPSDTMFHAEARAGYDAALCCYHDQALIPLKTIHFHDAVNITLGLPLVRTSPDHGTAFGIAGHGVARPDSMIAALRMAAEAARHRAGATTVAA